MSAPLDILARVVLDRRVARCAERQPITAVASALPLIETTTRLRLRSIVMG
jgi:hypothetical protein